MVTDSAPSIGTALAGATRRLAATSDTPRLDAELLMAHALAITREALLLGGGAAPVPDGFAPLVARRLRHEPVAYIVGRQGFWSIELDVTPATLIPRPDTETLLEVAVRRFGRAGPKRVLDLGTGSGALLLAALAEWPRATGLGVDASAAAVAVVATNAARLGLAGRAEVRLGGWAAAADGGFDLVLCNPPYVGTGECLPESVRAFEPASALFAGTDGLDDYRALAPLLRLPRDGLACFEIGVGQSVAVAALFGAAGFAARVAPDLAGRDRCVAITHRA